MDGRLYLVITDWAVSTEKTGLIVEPARNDSHNRSNHGGHHTIGPLPDYVPRCCMSVQHCTDQSIRNSEFGVLCWRPAYSLSHFAADAAAG